MLFYGQGTHENLHANYSIFRFNQYDVILHKMRLILIFFLLRCCPKPHCSDISKHELFECTNGLPIEQIQYTHKSSWLLILIPDIVFEFLLSLKHIQHEYLLPENISRITQNTWTTSAPAQWSILTDQQVAMQFAVGRSNSDPSSVSGQGFPFGLVPTTRKVVPEWHTDHWPARQRDLPTRENPALLACSSLTVFLPTLYSSKAFLLAKGYEKRYGDFFNEGERNCSRVGLCSSLCEQPRKRNSNGWPVSCFR